MSGGNLKQGITAYSDDTPDLVMTTAFINVEKITLPLSNETCIVYDMSGQGRYREQWQYFYPDIDGIFFVIDATDKERLSVAAEVLHEMARHPGLQGR